MVKPLLWLAIWMPVDAVASCVPAEVEAPTGVAQLDAWVDCALALHSKRPQTNADRRDFLRSLDDLSTRGLSTLREPVEAPQLSRLYYLFGLAEPYGAVQRGTMLDWFDGVLTVQPGFAPPDTSRRIAAVLEQAEARAGTDGMSEQRAPTRMVVDGSENGRFPTDRGYLVQTLRWDRSVHETQWVVKGARPTIAPPEIPGLTRESFSELGHRALVSDAHDKAMFELRARLPTTQMAVPTAVWARVALALSMYGDQAGRTDARRVAFTLDPGLSEAGATRSPGTHVYRPAYEEGVAYWVDGRAVSGDIDLSGPHLLQTQSDGRWTHAIVVTPSELPDGWTGTRMAADRGARISQNTCASRRLEIGPQLGLAEREFLRTYGTNSTVFDDTMLELRESLRCLVGPTTAEHAARVHQLEGLQAYRAGDADATEAAFSAARRIAPELSLLGGELPAESPEASLYAAAGTEPGTERPVLASSRKLYVDGVRGGSVWTDHPSVVQLAHRDDLQTWYLWSTDALPAELTVERGRKGKWAGLGVSLAAVAGGAVLMGINGSVYEQQCQPIGNGEVSCLGGYIGERYIDANEMTKRVERDWAIGGGLGAAGVVGIGITSAMLAR